MWEFWMLKRLLSSRLLKNSINYEGSLKYISSSFRISSISSFSPLSINFSKYLSNSSVDRDDFLETVLEDIAHSVLILSLTVFSAFDFFASCSSIHSLGGNWLRKFLYRKDEAMASSLRIFNVLRELTVICLFLIYCSFASLFCTCFSNCSSIFLV